MVASLKIGIAEDEPDMREFYNIVIPELGHRLLWVAQNGVELVKFANQALPDLLIVDIKMPLLDGLDAVRTVTRDQPLMVIVVSGHHDQETMERAEVEQLMGFLSSSNVPVLRVKKERRIRFDAKRQVSPSPRVGVLRVDQDLRRLFKSESR